MPTSRIRPVVRLHHTRGYYSLKKKSSVRKIFTRDGKLSKNPQKIMDELESFYADLYDGSSCPSDSATSMFLDNSRGFPALADDSTKICEGKLGYSECFSVLETFPKNKTPGNDVLTIEFYLAFWPLFGRLSGYQAFVQTV